MFNPFAQFEKNLGRAGLLLALVFLGAIALSLALSALGHAAELAILAAWCAMPFIAWFMSKAAAAQGRSRWLYGVASLLPPLAILSFFSLFSREVELRAEAAVRRYDGE